MLIALMAALAAAISVEVAPDQPFRQVYVDEPLVVEFMSDTAVVLDGTLTVEDAFGARETAPLPNIRLEPGQPHWQPFPRIALQRGAYTAHIVANDATHELAFCRVDRPAPDIAPPALVHVTYLDDTLRLALKGLSVQGVRIDASQPEVLNAFATQSGEALRLAVSFPGIEDAGDSLTALAESLNGLPARWETGAPAGIEGLVRTAEILQHAGNAAPMVLVVNSPETVSNLLAAGAGRHVSALVIPPAEGAAADPGAYRAAAETQGYEGFPLFPRVSGLDLHGALLQQTLVRLLASPGVLRIELDAAHLMAGPRQPAADYPRLVPLFVRLSGMRPAGEAPLGPRHEAYLFRLGAQWTLVAWGEGELRIPMEPGTQADAFTSFNNPLPTHRPEPDLLAVPLDEAPVFVTGTDGRLPTLVAGHMARNEAALFVKTAKTAAALAPKAAASVAAIASGAERPAPRLDFFTILQALPDLEGYWHSGGLTRADAVPAIASLARLASHLATLEAARGEPFLEPLPDTLAKCGEYLSRYLTGATQRARVPSRGDWLLQEVNRLTAEARMLQDGGSSTEASAVAAVAEWRARSLIEAAKARPLHEPEDNGPTEPPTTDKERTP